MTGTWQAPQGVPAFPVGFTAPDIGAWLGGNTGLPGVWSLPGGSAGPHVVVTGLIHGNEIAGAVVLDQMLRAPPKLRQGRLTLVFANLAAFAAFNPAQPTASRFVEEDMNRVWHPSVLDGPRGSLELARARALRPLIDTADVLIDLHSMLWPSDPLILCGSATRGREFAVRIATPGLVVADAGHASGRRLIDYPRFIDAAGSATAVLVEAGQHWQTTTIGAMQASLSAALAAAGVLSHPAIAPKPRVAEVTHTITAASTGFAFSQPYRGGDIIPHARTLIATDAAHEIRTPYDNCLLIMPSLRPSRGHTAVRLARVVG